MYRSLLLVVITTGGLAQTNGVGDAVYSYAANHKVEETLAYYQHLKETKADDYDFSESELNKLGYRLLGEGRNDLAIAIFKLNTQVYSQSPNTYDSLGEAYMLAGDRQRAIDFYQKALALIPEAALAEDAKQRLSRNARLKLKKLNKPKDAGLPKAVLDFLDKGDHPFGKIHPDAPAETLQFGQLAGIWKITNHAKFQGQWFSGYEAIWTWKYILGGHGVQDFWFQPEENLPPTFPLPRDNMLTQLRIYNPATTKWWVAWVTNGAGVAQGNVYGSFQAESMGDGNLVMRPTSQRGGQSRIVFYDIQEERFQWRNETSADGGKTWQVTARIDAVRIPYPSEKR